jgi:hypothetical protein
MSGSISKDELMVAIYGGTFGKNDGKGSSNIHPSLNVSSST